METAFTRLLGIEHPIVQAPIGGLTDPAARGGGLECRRPRDARAHLDAEPDEISEADRGDPRAHRPPVRRQPRSCDWPQAERLAAALDAGVRVHLVLLGRSQRRTSRRSTRPAPIAALTVGSAEEADARVDAGRRRGRRPGLGGGWPRLGRAWRRCRSSRRWSTPSAPTPVVAAGGIADGRGLAAVLALGPRRAGSGPAS